MSNNKEENEKLLDNSLNRALLALLKFIESEKEKDILIKVPPAFGGRVEYPVIPDPRNTEFKNERFILTLYRSRGYNKGMALNLISKSSNTILCRFDYGDTFIHSNPDRTKVIGSHMHLFCKSNASSYAYSIPNYFEKDGIAIAIKKFFDEVNIDYSNVTFEVELW